MCGKMQFLFSEGGVSGLVNFDITLYSPNMLDVSVLNVYGLSHGEL